MRGCSPLRVAACAGMVIASVHGVGAGNPFSFFSAPSGDVFIVTDVTEAGKSFEAPTKDNPMHCVALNFGCSFGSIVGDTLPDSVAISTFVGKLLAEQGYQGSDDRHPPQLVLTIQWGVLQGKDGYNLAFLGADKVGLIEEEGMLSSFERSYIPEAAHGVAFDKIRALKDEDLYVVTVCGFDYTAYRAGKAEMLWKTRIACATTGLSMARALPDMITLAAPAVGRETEKVIVTNPADKREGRVDLGPLQVIEEEKSGRGK